MSSLIHQSGSGRDGDAIFADFAAARLDGRVADAASFREELCLRFLPLAWSMATKAPAWIIAAIGGVDDAFSAAIVGIMQAIDHFRNDVTYEKDGQTRTVKFITYAHNVVYRQLQSQARMARMIHVPYYLEQSVETDDESKNANVRAAQVAMRNVSSLTLHDEEGDEWTWQPESADTDCFADDMEVVRLAMRCLPEYDATVIAHIYGLDGKGGGCLRTAGEHFGVSKERVRQVETRALAKIKQRIDQLERKRPPTLPMPAKKKPMPHCTDCLRRRPCVRGKCKACAAKRLAKAV